MPVRIQHDQKENSFYFVTFTCYKWLQLFKEANAYDAVYKWFDHLYGKNIYVIGYVTMPNHIHILLYFPQMPKSLNTIISNAKRFMAYEIVTKLKQSNREDILDILFGGVKVKERKKGQIHKVFEESFDAKECYSEKFIFQKLSYIHLNPISKKWNLVNDFTEYEHSSASFYEMGIKKYNRILHISEALNWKLSGSPAEDPERT